MNLQLRSRNFFPLFLSLFHFSLFAANCSVSCYWWVKERKERCWWWCGWVDISMVVRVVVDLVDLMAGACWGLMVASVFSCGFPFSLAFSTCLLFSLLPRRDYDYWCISQLTGTTESTSKLDHLPFDFFLTDEVEKKEKKVYKVSPKLWAKVCHTSFRTVRKWDEEIGKSVLSHFMLSRFMLFSPSVFNFLFPLVQPYVCESMLCIAWRMAGAITSIGHDYHRGTKLDVSEWEKIFSFHSWMSIKQQVYHRW